MYVTIGTLTSGATSIFTNIYAFMKTDTPIIYGYTKCNVPNGFTVNNSSFMVKLRETTDQVFGGTTVNYGNTKYGVNIIGASLGFEFTGKSSPMFPQPDGTFMAKYMQTSVIANTSTQVVTVNLTLQLSAL